MNDATVLPTFTTALHLAIYLTAGKKGGPPTLKLRAYLPDDLLKAAGEPRHADMSLDDNGHLCLALFTAEDTDNGVSIYVHPGSTRDNNSITYGVTNLPWPIPRCVIHKRHGRPIIGTLDRETRRWRSLRPVPADYIAKSLDESADPQARLDLGTESRDLDPKQAAALADVRKTKRNLETALKRARAAGLKMRLRYRPENEAVELTAIAERITRHEIEVKL